MNEYWFDRLSENKSWTSLWSGYIICGNCGGIREFEGKCPACSIELVNPQPTIVKNEYGEEFKIPMNAYMGAEGRYEDYVYLNMLEYEWKRPVSSFDDYGFLSVDKKPAAKAIIALIFWTYFETRIERLITTMTTKLPTSISEHLLKRYQTISSRTDELYKILFGKNTSYFNDLNSLGFNDITELLLEVQDRRNKFMHGKPEAIDDKLIEDIVRSLKKEHLSWIKVYNLRLSTML